MDKVINEEILIRIGKQCEIADTIKCKKDIAEEDEGYRRCETVEIGSTVHQVNYSRRPFIQLKYR